MLGDCALLALAIQARTGWRIVCVPDDGGGKHCLVQCRDGRLLDADGWHDPREYELFPFDQDAWDIPERWWRVPGLSGDAGQLLREVGSRS